MERNNLSVEDKEHLLSEFLRTRRVTRPFYRNVAKHFNVRYSDARSMVINTCDNIQHYLKVAFPWNTSEESTTYWHKVEQDYQRYLKRKGYVI